MSRLSEYTTIRVPLRVKRNLEIFAKKINEKSLTKALEKAIEIASREADSFKGDLNIVLKSLKKARDIGETDASKIDQYLYGD